MKQNKRDGWRASKIDDKQRWGENLNTGVERNGRKDVWSTRMKRYGSCEKSMEGGGSDGRSRIGGRGKRNKDNGESLSYEVEDVPEARKMVCNEGQNEDN